MSLQHLGVPHVEAVAGAGVVEVEARLVRDEPVVGRVVDATERQRRPDLVAFGGVVVDDIEDHLDARRVQRPHHLLELVDLAARITRRGVARVGREVADRVVAPVVASVPGSSR